MIALPQRNADPRKTPPMLIHKVKGAVLFAEGESSDLVYRIEEGAAQVTKGYLAIGSLVPGDFVGEIGALVGSPRSATVTFTADSVVSVYDRPTFAELLATDIEQGLRLLDALSLRTRALTEYLGHPDAALAQWRGSLSRRGGTATFWRYVGAALSFVTDFLRQRAKFVPAPFGAARARLVLPRALPRQILARGASLFCEGDASQSVYFIESGSLVATKTRGAGERRLGRLRAGEFVGEMGVLETAPRTATVRATEDTILVVLSPSAFDELLRTNKGAFFQVLDTLCERAHQLDQQLAVSASGPTTGVDAIYEAVTSMESVAQLAEQRLAHDMVKARTFLREQLHHGREMMSIYTRYLRGEASREEMELANAHLRDYVKIAGLGALLVLPGGVLTVPLIVKMGKAVGVDLMPGQSDRENRSDVS
jgi:CRP-like cAMP-binding protein